MAFGKPDTPKVAKPPNVAMPAIDAPDEMGRLNIPGTSPLSGSLITTGSTGLKRKAETRKPSLISGGVSASQ